MEEIHERLLNSYCELEIEFVHKVEACELNIEGE